MPPGCLDCWVVTAASGDVTRTTGVKLAAVVVVVVVVHVVELIAIVVVVAVGVVILVSWGLLIVIFLLKKRQATSRGEKRGDKTDGLSSSVSVV